MGLIMSIDGIHVVRRKLASGAVRYHYYAYRGGPKFWESDGERVDEKRLPDGFPQAYTTAIEDENRPAAGTFGRALALYRERSPKFKRMRPKGKMARIKYLDKWSEMPMRNTKPARMAPLEAFDSRGIIRRITAYRDRVWGHSPSAADEAVIALSAFLTWCRKEGMLDWNRAQGIDSVYERPVSARVWEAGEQAAFLLMAPQHVRWAFQLALFTGLRLSDLVRLTVADRTREHLIIPTGKSGGRNTALVPLVPELRDLLEELDAERARLAVAPTTLLFSSRGTPWTADGLKSSFYRIRDRAVEAEDKPTIHDLRKTAATHMVVLQQKHITLITDALLCDMFGWTLGTLTKMKRIYVSDTAVIEAMSRK